MAKFSPHVFKTSLMLENVIVFCGSVGNKFLFSNENKLVTTWWPVSVEKVLPSASDTTNKRNVLRKLLKSEVLNKFVPIMDKMAQKHFETEWKGMDQIMTHDLIQNLTFHLACNIFLGIIEPEYVKYLSGPFQNFAPGIFTIPIDLPGTPLRKAINASKFMRNEFIAIIKQRKIDLANEIASPTQDILSHILCDEYGKVMAEPDIADLIIGFLIGGHDNISSTCLFIVKFLAELPDVYQQVYNEQTEIEKTKETGELLNSVDLSKMNYSWNVAREVLRLVPPLQGTFREVVKDFVYNGYSIPKGWKLYWSAIATHKNPEFFPEPHKFEPSRFDGKGPAPYTFVPFGGGQYMCPGREYTRLQILIFMHHLVKNFKWEKVIPNEQMVINPMPKLEKGLPIRLYPHHKA